MLSKSLYKQINRLINPSELLKLIDFNAERSMENAEGILCYCPIHGDNVVKTLVIDKMAQSFRCRYSLCPGHKGGSLIDLWAMAKDISVDKAALELVRKFELNVDIPDEHDFFLQEYQQALASFDQKDYNLARKYVMCALEYCPDDLKANKLLTLIDYEEKADTNVFSRLSSLQKLVKDEDDLKELDDLFSVLTKKGGHSTKILRKRIEFLDATEQNRKLLSELCALAEAYIGKQEYQKALRSYHEIINADPANKKAKDMIAELLPKIKSQQEAVDTFFKMYEKHMNIRNIEASIQDLEEIIVLDPSSGMAYEELSNLYLSSAQQDKACAIRLKYAQLLYEDYEVTQALNYAMDALKLDPKNEDIYLFLAKVYLENNISSAKANGFFLTAGKICFQKQKYDEAVQYFERISAEGKDNIETLKTLLKLYLKLKNESQAVFYAIRLIDKYVGAEKMDKALVIFRNIHRFFPKNKEIKEKYQAFKKLYNPDKK